MRKSRSDIRQGVHSRIRKKVRGSAERPRLAVFRSLNHIYAQVIDDNSGTTLATASSTEKSLGLKSGGNVDAAKTIGVTEQCYYRWRREYGGLKLDQARRLKQLERENARLRKAVADLTLDKVILAEAARGNY